MLPSALPSGHRWTGQRWHLGLVRQRLRAELYRRAAGEMFPTTSERPPQAPMGDGGAVCTHAACPQPSSISFSCPVRELPGGAHREQDTQASTGGLRGGCPPSPLPRKQLGPNNALRVLSGPCCPCQPYYLSPWANSSCSRAHGQAVIMGTRGLGEPSSSLPPVPGARQPDVRAGISATGGPAATEPPRLPSLGRRAPAQAHGRAAHHSLKASK